MSRPTEDDIIATIFAPIAGPGSLGLVDDAACLTPPAGQDQVLTTDTITAGVHFFVDDPPQAIAAKALRVNLSDLAAKAAIPQGFLINLALPPDWTPDWLRAFAQQLGDDATAFACPLLGGDTVKILGPLTISITAIGHVPKGRMVRRDRARPGDILYVSGTIGDAALGLLIRRPADRPSWTEKLSGQGRDDLTQRYLYPQPRLALSQALLTHAHAAMDISDGLAGDLTKMLHHADVTADIAFADVPLSAAASAALAVAPELAATIVSGGDDYEILAAVPPDAAASFEQEAARAHVAVARIGTLAKGRARPIIRDAGGAPLALAAASFQHF